MARQEATQARMVVFRPAARPWLSRSRPSTRPAAMEKPIRMRASVRGRPAPESNGFIKLIDFKFPRVRKQPKELFFPFFPGLFPETDPVKKKSFGPCHPKMELWYNRAKR